MLHHGSLGPLQPSAGKAGSVEGTATGAGYCHTPVPSAYVCLVLSKKSSSCHSLSLSPWCFLPPFFPPFPSSFIFPPFLFFKGRVSSPSWLQTSNAIKDNLELLTFLSHLSSVEVTGISCYIQVCSSRGQTQGFLSRLTSQALRWVSAPLLECLGERSSMVWRNSNDREEQNYF